MANTTRSTILTGGAPTQGVNVGSGEGVFRDKCNDITLVFKSLKSTDENTLQISGSNDTIYFTAVGSSGGTGTTNIYADNGLSKIDDTIILGGDNALTGDTIIKSGNHGLAFGSGNVYSTGDSSFTFGITTTINDFIIASGDGSFAFGRSNNYGNIESTRIGSIAGGYAYNGNIKTEGRGALALGQTNNGGAVIAKGDGSIAMGYSNTASLIKSMGYGGTAKGHAWNGSTCIISNRDGAMAIGAAYNDNASIIATGITSFAFGAADTANIIAGHGDIDTFGAIAMGYANDHDLIAYDSGSVALGYSVCAYNEGAFVAGYCNIGSGVTGNAVLGKYNKLKSGSILEIGIGSDNSHRCNVLEAYTDGSVITPNLSTGTSNSMVYINETTGELLKGNKFKGADDILACNGITKIGDAFVLGGDNALTGDTIIKSGNHGLAFGAGDISATGSSALAQGYGTKAYGSYSHAEGSFTEACGHSSHAEGGATHAIGEKSHVEGCGNYATKIASHAEGCRSCANGIASHAEGCSSCADGDASHAENAGTVATGFASHAEGGYTKAYGQRSHAEGSNTITCKYSSHAEGGHTIACEQYSHAEGYLTIAFGNQSHTEGYCTKACSDNAHAEGFFSCATGCSSHAEGYYTCAIGKNSHAEGNTTKACGIDSHAEGSNTFTVGLGSHAEGYYTCASGYSSHAEGCYTCAVGDYSHAEGGHTCAIGEHSHAEGYSTIANVDYSHVNGIYNIGCNNTILEVGVGTAYNAKCNAFEIYNDGSGGKMLGTLTVGDITCTSDGRLKKDVEPINCALCSIVKIQGIEHKFINVNDNKCHYGLIAQDIENYIPYSVSKVSTDPIEKKLLDDDFKYTVDYASIVPVLIEAIKELEKRVEDLENK